MMQIGGNDEEVFYLLSEYEGERMAKLALDLGNVIRILLQNAAVVKQKSFIPPDEEMKYHENVCEAIGTLGDYLNFDETEIPF